MISLLSPAKNLNDAPVDLSLEPTHPALQSDVEAIARVAKTQSANELKSLMHISDDLAQLNAERFKTFVLNGKSNSAQPAAMMFNGDVYRGFDARNLDKDSLDFAQDHVRILSGLYGVLRPLDLMQPYRLEMGTKLENPRGKTLYDFWGDKISKALNADLDAQDSRTIVNLASNEYFKAVDKKALRADIIAPAFYEMKDGKTRIISFYAKYARGLMARWIVDNRVDHADGLKDFNVDGYKFDAKATAEAKGKLIFKRKQPPPKS